MRGACNGWQTCLDGEGRLHLYGVAEDLGITGLSADEWHTSEWIGFFFGGGAGFCGGSCNEWKFLKNVGVSLVSSAEPDGIISPK